MHTNAFLFKAESFSVSNTNSDSVSHSMALNKLLNFALIVI